MAARQQGVVTRRQLLEAGLSSSAIERLLQSRRYRVLHCGVYLVLPMPLAHTREMAAVLASGPGATLGYVSALVHWDLLSRATAGRAVDVITLGSRGCRPGIRAHRVKQLRNEDWIIKESIPVTTPYRSIVDAAGMLGPRELEGAIARAERERLVDLDDLRRFLAGHEGRRGVCALRSVLETPGGPALTRSSAEELFLALVRRAGLSAPECNVMIGRHEVDFVWRTASLVVEVDGFRYHSSRSRFESDRERDAELAAAGLQVVRLSWRQITEESVATAVRLGQALARAGACR